MGWGAGVTWATLPPIWIGGLRMYGSGGWRPRACAALAAAILFGCNVVSSGAGGGGSALDADVQVAIEPAEGIVHRNGWIPFFATVTGGDEGIDRGVTWSVAEGPGGGWIDEDGIYTAPDAHGSWTIVAVAKANPRRRATATVTVGELEMELTPTLIEVAQGATIQFEPKVTGTWNPTVSWTVEAGEITDDGLYTAPHSEGTFKVVATSNADPTRRVKAEVIVQELLITMEPWAVTVDQGSTTQLGAVLTGTVDGRVTWSAEVGTVDQNGRYTAPFASGTFPVRATSVSNPRRSAAASVTVRGVSVVMDPWWTELDQGASMQFATTLEGTVDQRVTWSASAGSIDEEGRFTAPHAPGDVHVTATSVGDPAASGRATVAVRQVGISLEPTLVSLGAGAGMTFVATVRGTVDTSVIWSADGGTIEANGFYTAPQEPGTYTITAAAGADLTKVATALVVVSAPPAALAWEGGQDGAWRLVEGEESSGRRLVLDLLGPGLGAGERLHLALAVGAGARWAQEDAAVAGGGQLEAELRGEELAIELQGPVEPGTLLSLAIEPHGAAAPGPVRFEVVEAALRDGAGAETPIEIDPGELHRF